MNSLFVAVLIVYWLGNRNINKVVATWKTGVLN